MNASGAKGEILKTNNSGTSWSRQNSGTLNNLNSIFFINENSGYTVGDGSKVLHTENAGGFSIGINESSEMQLDIFPNPSEGVITFTGINISRIEIYDASGRNMLSVEAPAPDLDLAGLGFDNGIYFFRIHSYNNISTGRVVLIKK